MAKFIWEAVDAQGQIHKGELTAKDKTQVMDLLAEQHLTPITVKVEADAKGIGSVNVFGGTIGIVEKILLFRHMSVMMKAGLGIKDIFDILIKDAEKPALKNILQQGLSNLERGQPLSGTLSQWPKQFPPVVIGLLKAGEVSGNLADVLDQLATQLKKDYDLRQKVVSVMVYPIILLVASLGLSIFLVTFVVPRITQAFRSSNIPLPTITKVFIAISDFFNISPIMPFIVIGALIGLGFYFFRVPSGQRLVVALAWAVPVSRMLVKKLALSRFSRTLANLIQAGLPILNALEVVANSVGNERYKNSILSARPEIQRGAPIAGVFRERAELFPHLLTSMMEVGEKTGNLEDMLRTVSEFYEDDADRSLKTLVTLIEPLMLLIMGLIVGSLALSILLPVYQFVGSLR